MEESENPVKDGIEFKEMSIEIDITQEIDEWICALPHNTSFREFKAWLDADENMIPDRSSIYSQAEDIWKGRISNLIPTKVYSEDIDKPINTYGPGDSNLAFRQKRHYFLCLNMVDQLNLTTHDQYIDPFVSEDMFIQVLMHHPVCKSRPEDIKNSVKAYYNGDYSTSIRLILPEFERLIRTFLKNEGAEITKKLDEGKYEPKSLSHLLDVKEITEYLDKNDRFYFKFFLCDKAGYNIRNKDLHGLSVDKQQQQALRALWSFGYLTRKLRNYERWLKDN